MRYLACLLVFPAALVLAQQQEQLPIRAQYAEQHNHPGVTGCYVEIERWVDASDDGSIEASYDKWVGDREAWTADPNTPKTVDRPMAVPAGATGRVRVKTLCCEAVPDDPNTPETESERCFTYARRDKRFGTERTRLDVETERPAERKQRQRTERETRERERDPNQPRERQGSGR